MTTTFEELRGTFRAMRTGAESLLALYLWRGGPLAARSTITGKAE